MTVPVLTKPSASDEMLKKAVDGDFGAFETLIKDYEKLIFSISYRITGNNEDAKDVSQEVLLKVYKNLGKCQSMSVFKSWVCTITRNTCIDLIRKSSNSRAESFDAMIETDEGEVPVQFKSDSITPEQAFLNKERHEIIQEAINRLPLAQKELIVLRDINGFSYDEMAEIAKTNVGTIKSRLFRARGNLKNILKNMLEQNKF